MDPGCGESYPNNINGSHIDCCSRLLVRRKVVSRIGNYDDTAERRRQRHAEVEIQDGRLSEMDRIRASYG